jgi:hypothetical protein
VEGRGDISLIDPSVSEKEASGVGTGKRSPSQSFSEREGKKFKATSPSPAHFCLIIS